MHTNWFDKNSVIQHLRKSPYHAMHLRSASDHLKDDEEVVFSAVFQNGNALPFASERLKNDKRIILTAISKNTSALAYAGLTARDNEEIMLAAVKECGSTFQYASDRLKNDVDFCLHCAKIDWYAIKYFEGEAKEKITISFVEELLRTEKANAKLLKKLSKIKEVEKPSFKRNISLPKQ